MVNRGLLIETIKVLSQTGTRVSRKRDSGRKATYPGKRVSKTGKVYWETRRNRTDSPNSNL